MIDKLTILIPVYNDDASSLVQALVAEARNVKGLDYEIIVFDDGSTDARCIDANHRLALLPGCNYVSAPHHPCRASMRNAWTYRLMKSELAGRNRASIIRHHSYLP